MPPPKQFVPEQLRFGRAIGVPLGVTASIAAWLYFLVWSGHNKNEYYTLRYVPPHRREAVRKTLPDGGKRYHD